jgi:hypothetical protein
MQGGKNWFLPKEMNANRFFCDSHWLEIWSNHFYPSMGPNGVSVAMDSEVQATVLACVSLVPAQSVNIRVVVLFLPVDVQLQMCIIAGHHSEEKYRRKF